MTPKPFLAPSLVALRAEIDATWPHRDRASDGWLGDTAHAARASDHNPDARGMVHAVDVDKDGIDVAAVLAATIGDPRVWYVIHDRKIWSRTYGWTPRPYTGANAHTHHIHVSVNHDHPSEQGTAPWLSKEDDMPTPRDIWKEPIKLAGDRHAGVALGQTWTVVYALQNKVNALEAKLDEILAAVKR